MSIKELTNPISDNNNGKVHVSIIIPAYNEEKVLKECLNSIALLDFPRDQHEVILVDDGSNDNTANILQSFRKEHIHFKVISKENGGKASAQNLGLKYARGDYVFITDADAVVEKDWINKMLNSFNNVDMVIGSYYAYNPKTWLEKCQNAHYLIKFKYGGVKGTPSAGVNNAFRKDIVNKIGYFDETKTSITGDFIRRAQDAGLKISYDPDIFVYTKATNNIRGFFKQKLRWREAGSSSVTGFCYTHGLSYILFGSLLIGIYLQNIWYFVITFMAVYMLSFSIYLMPFFKMAIDEKDRYYAKYFILYELVEMSIRLVLPLHLAYRLIWPRRKPTFEAERD